MKPLLIYAGAILLVLAAILGCSTAGDGGGSANADFTVSVTTKIDGDHPYFGEGSSFGYVINGDQGRELTLQRGVTYTFSVNTPGHPFYFSTDPVGQGAGEVQNGVTGSKTTNGTVTFTPDDSHPDLLYYQCGIHANMGWMINIVS